MSLCDLEYVIPKLESLSDPNKNRIELHRDRVGNWRVIIDEHFTTIFAEGRHQDLATAIQMALQNLNEQQSKNSIP